MKEKKIIWSMFDRLRPIIVEKLLNPEDRYVRSGGAQLVIPLSGGTAEAGTAEKVFTAVPFSLLLLPDGRRRLGEEEEYEVAVTCHIDTEGHLADTPVRKPYTGPRR